MSGVARAGSGVGPAEAEQPVASVTSRQRTHRSGAGNGRATGRLTGCAQIEPAQGVEQRGAALVVQVEAGVVGPAQALQRGAAGQLGVVGAQAVFTGQQGAVGGVRKAASSGQVVRLGQERPGLGGQVAQQARQGAGAGVQGVGLGRAPAGQGVVPLGQGQRQPQLPQLGVGQQRQHQHRAAIVGSGLVRLAQAPQGQCPQVAGGGLVAGTHAGLVVGLGLGHHQVELFHGRGQAIGAQQLLSQGQPHAPGGRRRRVQLQQLERPGQKLRVLVELAQHRQGARLGPAVSGVAGQFHGLEGGLAGLGRLPAAGQVLGPDGEGAAHAPAPVVRAAPRRGRAAARQPGQQGRQRARQQGQPER